jgi:hypothetical protein
MRRLALAISILAGAACAPGSGEYGSCTTTPECQVNLFCVPGSPDGGDGICRVQCGLGTGSQDCPGGEVCGPLGGIAFCSKDGGY